MPLDLSDSKARSKLADRLRSEPIAGLCNSAGFGTSGVFHELPLERESEEVTLNALALMELTHAALPGMVERGAGAVMNIASIAGFQPVPYMAVYSATKAFVQTFSEAVHEELHGTGVSVTCLCPGPVPTEWAEIANAERFSIPIAQVSPRDVAEAAIGGMLAGRRSRGARRRAQGRQHRRQIRAAQPAAARDSARLAASAGDPAAELESPRPVTGVTFGPCTGRACGRMPLRIGGCSGGCDEGAPRARFAAGARLRRWPLLT